MTNVFFVFLFLFSVSCLWCILQPNNFLRPCNQNLYSQEIKVYAVGRNTRFKNTWKQSSGNFEGIEIWTCVRTQYGQRATAGFDWLQMKV